MARSHSGQKGFTLIEMIFAVGILAFGLTALIGVLSVGVSTRRTAELKSRAALVADAVVQHLQEDVLSDPRFGEAAQAAPGKAGDAIAPVVLAQIPGWPELSASIELTRAESDADLLLAEVTISWRERGEAVSERFHRIVAREVPFARRVSLRRSKP
jgi:prepilin-type N-terminal cleavage/methylation domain-containing protein